MRLSRQQGECRDFWTAPFEYITPAQRSNQLCALLVKLTFTVMPIAPYSLISFFVYISVQSASIDFRCSIISLTGIETAQRFSTWIELKHAPLSQLFFNSRKELSHQFPELHSNNSAIEFAKPERTNVAAVFPDTAMSALFDVMRAQQRLASAKRINTFFV